MYRVQIPVMNDNLDQEKVLAELKRAGASRIWLCSARGTEGEDYLRGEEQRLRENREFFEANGIEVGVWINSLGHGGALMQDGPDALKQAGKYELIVGLDGALCGDSFCPTGEAFSEDYSSWIARIAATGAKMIMLDDDYRLSLRPTGNGCCCDRHMAEYCERVGETVTREQLRELIFTGGPGKYRDAWLDMGRDALMSLAKKIRAKVDQVNPETRVGFCAVMSTWDVDGVNAIELTHAFAGRTRPFLRTIGAPYWCANEPKDKRLSYVISHTRLQRHWCEGEGIELFSEGDAYPRPRMATPASYLEMFDMALRADGGMDGILKYMIDYTSSIDYERGYIDRMARNAPAYRWIEEHLTGGAAEGVDVFSAYDRIRHAEIGDERSLKQINNAFHYASAHYLVNDCCLPIAYGTRNVHAVCGESARALPEEYAKDGLVLDISAAKILMERGMDVGILEMGRTIQPGAFEMFAEPKERVAVSGISGMRALTLREGAEVLSQIDGECVCYRYENAEGARFIVYAFDMEDSWKGWGVCRSYSRQKQLAEGVEWAGRKKLPAVCLHEPDVFLICKRTEEGLNVGLWNFSADYILNGRVRLDRAYSGLETFGAKGALEGDEIALEDEIPPFSFAGIVLKN